jgi:hypothetical protein
VGWFVWCLGVVLVVGVWFVNVLVMYLRYWLLAMMGERGKGFWKRDCLVLIYIVPGALMSMKYSTTRVAQPVYILSTPGTGTRYAFIEGRCERLVPRGWGIVSWAGGAGAFVCGTCVVDSSLDSICVG